MTEDGEAPAVAINGNGDIAVAWTRRSAYTRFFSFSGEPRSKELLLGEFPEQFATGLSLAANDAGDFVVAWAANANEGNGASKLRVFARSLTQESPLSAKPYRVNGAETSGQEQMPAVAIDEWGQPLILWVADSRVWGRRFHNDGRPLSERLVISAGTEGAFPAVAMHPDGHFVAMWTTKDGGKVAAGVQARVFAEEGQPVSPEIRLNTFAGQQGRGTASVDGHGVFTAAWGGNGSSGRGIQIRQLDANGLPRGNQLRLVPHDPLAEHPPGLTGGVVNVTSSHLGDLVLVWMSNNPKGADRSGWGIVGQVWSSALQPTSPTIQLNTTTEGHQEYPSAAMNAAGQLVVAWQDRGIRARTCRLIR